MDQEYDMLNNKVISINPGQDVTRGENFYKTDREYMRVYFLENLKENITRQIRLLLR